MPGCVAGVEDTAGFHRPSCAARMHEGPGNARARRTLSGRRRAARISSSSWGRPWAWPQLFGAGALAGGSLCLGRGLGRRRLGRRRLGRRRLRCGRLGGRGGPCLGCGLGGGAALTGVSTVLAAAAAAASRLVRDSAARALPAAVCSPLAFVALPAAMRALAALTAAALLVCRATLPVVTVWAPPRVGVHLEHQAALAPRGRVGMDGADLGRLVQRRDGQDDGCLGLPPAHRSRRPTRAFLTSVLAAERRGCRISLRRSAWRTRFLPWGERAPVQVREEWAKSISLGCVRSGDRTPVRPAGGAGSVDATRDREW